MALGSWPCAGDCGVVWIPWPAGGANIEAEGAGMSSSNGAAAGMLPGLEAGIAWELGSIVLELAGMALELAGAGAELA